MLRAFGLAIFLSAALLFLVQPMSGKVLLPLLGGSPAVWNTCMVFFQAVLLLGYGYAHLLTTRVALRWQAVVHIGLMVVAGVTLPAPVNVGEPRADESPEVWVLRTLLLTVGLPFFVVSTSGPLLQKWFSRTDHPAAKDPYFLYAASNAGSVIGLLAYPFVIEPNLSRVEQSATWTIGFWLLAPAIAGCAWMMLRRVRPAEAGAAVQAAVPPLGWARRLKWVLLAFVPSSLCVGVTQHISTDVAAIPLLWIVPLLLYLTTFILAFSGRWGWSSKGWGWVLVGMVALLMLVMVTAVRNPVWAIVPIHLVVFFVAAMMCHRRLAEDRPDASRLTEFYLMLSVGGVLGGAANALVAPLVFNDVLEYPLALGLACLLRPQVGAWWSSAKPLWRTVGVSVACVAAFVLFVLLVNIDAASNPGHNGETAPLLTTGIARSMIADGYTERSVVNVLRGGVPWALAMLLLFYRGSLRFALASTALMVGSLWIGSGGVVLHRERTFFGVIEVVQNPAATWRALYHGTTLHGMQAQTETLRSPTERTLDLPQRDRLFWGGDDAFTRVERVKWMHLIPSTYYHPSGPIGEVVHVMQQENRLHRAAMVGLGLGSLAGYARPGMSIDFFEIDPAVVNVARNPDLFRYVFDAQQLPDVTFRGFVGDGRLGVRDAMDQDNVTPSTYDLIAIDAFSSDAVPVHLITREAVGVYLAKLRPGGILAFHISSRYFDLAPVLARLAKEHHLTAWQLNDTRATPLQFRQGKKESTWFILARSDADLGALAAKGTRWTPQPDDPRYPLWTDDYSNLFSVFVGWRISPPEPEPDRTAP